MLRREFPAALFALLFGSAVVAQPALAGDKDRDFQFFDKKTKRRANKSVRRSKKRLRRETRNYSKLGRKTLKRADKNLRRAMKRWAKR